MTSGKSKLELLLPLLLIVASLALWWPSFGVFFSLDDHEFLLRASGHEAWPDQFRRPLSTQLYFDAAWALFGAKAWLYHLVQLILHMAGAWMLLLIGRRLGMKVGAAFAAAALFALTPVAFTSLHWISGVQEVSMAFFALLAAWLALGESRASAYGALAAFLAALLCKESAALLLPAMALLMPGERGRRLRMGLGGIALALLVLVASRAFATRPVGDPYETGYGLNLIWNLGTYLAWMTRIWRVYPDQIPQAQPSLAIWGMGVPALLALAAWRLPDWRRAIGRASLIFLLLLLPVLPLLRHSYFYYLYLPLAPLWLLAGEGLARLDRGRRWMLASLLILFALHSAWSGSERRSLELGDGLLADPVLRYARFAETTVGKLRESEAPKSGDMIIMVPFIKNSADLAEGLAKEKNAVRMSFLPVERAVLGGKALKTFFPEIQSAQFAERVPEGDEWRMKSFWWTYGEGMIEPLGLGERGRHKLARLFYKMEQPARAAEQLEALLLLHPEDANLLHDLGTVELSLGHRKAVEEILEKLKVMASQPEAGETIHRAYADLWKIYETQNSQEP